MRHRPSDSAAGRTWSFASRPEQPEVRSDGLKDFERALDWAWRELLLEHMSFGIVSNDERERLLRAFHEVERVFAEPANATLRVYYREAYFGSAADAEVLDVEAAERLRHVVLMQAQLMEQAFFTLTLSRAANAPVNRGWMNLFRRWAGSTRFNHWFDQYRELFSRQFVRSTTTTSVSTTTRST